VNKVYPDPLEARSSPSWLGLYAGSHACHCGLLMSSRKPGWV